MELDLESKRLASCIAFSIRRSKLCGHGTIAPYLERALHILVTRRMPPVQALKISLFDALHDVPNHARARDREPGITLSASPASENWTNDSDKGAHAASDSVLTALMERVLASARLLQLCRPALRSWKRLKPPMLDMCRVPRLPACIVHPKGYLNGLLM